MRWLFEHRLKKARLKLLILDVDGVLTDGGLYYFDNAVEGKRFNVQDGLGMKRLMEAGVAIAIISGRASPATERRLKQLGVRYIYLNVTDKVRQFEVLKQQLALSAEEIAYLGDDLPDLAVMQRVGWPLAVANALPEVKRMARYVTKRYGGDGAVREVCDLLCKAR